MHWMVGSDRLDNTISYATPTIAGGLQLFAQYSFQTGTNADPGVEESKERHNTRRASAAFRWQGQSLTAVGVLDRIMNTHKDGADYGEDTTIASLTVNFLVHPDVRLFVVGQGFKNVYSAPGTPEHPVSKLISAGNLAPDNQSGIAGRGFDGWVASLNAQIKCFGGDLYLTSAYDDWEYKGHVVDGQTTDLKRVLFGAAFEYPLSKHTHLYASANWTHGSGLFDTKNFSDSSDPNSSQVMAGLTYFF
ncbi:porin, partial [Sutterella wadsworthensis]|uniref:porin n=1 Tax=Sutterella wadsworthensis TaxID=40545 RepID=UPI00243255F3